MAFFQTNSVVEPTDVSPGEPALLALWCDDAAGVCHLDVDRGREQIVVDVGAPGLLGLSGGGPKPRDAVVGASDGAGLHFVGFIEPGGYFFHFCPCLVWVAVLCPPQSCSL